VALELAINVAAEIEAAVPALQLPIVPGLPAEPVAEIQKDIEVRAKVLDEMFERSLAVVVPTESAETVTGVGSMICKVVKLFTSPSTGLPVLGVAITL